MSPAESEALLQAVREPLLARVLTPYKPHCRYIASAVAEVPGKPADTNGDDEALVSLHGQLGIPESCYIDDTGHFNSVEFNLCFNQLFYTLVGHCVDRKLLPTLEALSLEEYLRRQLPDVLIHSFSSVFKRPIDTRAFEGRIALHSITDRGRFVFFKTSCSFWDAQGGYARGEVTLVLVDHGQEQGASHD